jgi:hypothetical protein
MLDTHTLEEHRTLSQDNKSQSDKFKDAAREHQADEDEARWEERLKKIARSKPPGTGPTSTD